MTKRKLTAQQELDQKLPQLKNLIDMERNNVPARVSTQDLDRLQAVLDGTGVPANQTVDQRLQQITAALDEIRAAVRKRPTAVATAQLDLDANLPEATVDFQAELARNLQNLRAVWKDRLSGVQPDLDRIDQLVTAKKFRTAQALVDQLTKKLQAQRDVEQKSVLQGTRDLQARADQLNHPDFVPTSVSLLSAGQFDQARDAYKELNAYQVGALNKRQQNALLRQLIDAIFASDAVPKVVGQDPTFFMQLILASSRLNRDADAKAELSLPDRFVADKLDKLGTAARPVAARMMKTQFKLAPKDLGPEVFNWMFSTLTLDDWNADADRLAPRGFNALWNTGNFDKIHDLVLQGVDPSMAASEAMDVGRGDREGIWSGYVQPLQHLLGNYVKAVGLLDAGSADPAVNTDKVKGARKILEAVEKVQEQYPPTKPRIMTKYKDVQNSKMLKAFVDDAESHKDKKPGTIWGFEDVRLPYVQAARETAFGQQPLRMWELWEAVGQTINKAGYPKLLSKPDEMIKECIAEGIKKIDEGIQQKKPDYAGRSRDDFVREFERDVTSYLQFLAKQSPAAKFATAELAGKDAQKLMGSFACKQGLWWAQETGRPVYYVLDGLKIQDAINYKVFKTNQINAFVTAIRDKRVPTKFLDVITLAEVREILKNWDKLEGTVKFVERGEIITDTARIRKWKAEMEAADSTGPERQYPSRVRLKATIDKLDPMLLNRLTDKQAVQLVNKSEMLKLAATSADPQLLVDYLRDECEILYDFSVLPKGIADLFKPVVERDATQPDAVQNLRQVLDVVPVDLRTHLQDAITRILKPPTSTASPVPTTISTTGPTDIQ